MSLVLPTVEPGDVRVWHARPEDVWPSPEAETGALGWLEPAERARYERFRRPTDRSMFLLGRVMARTLVGSALGVEPQAWRWREGDRGRPEIDEPACRLSFNIAHSAGLVVCAVARDAEVGVDVEYRLRPIVDAAIVPRYCSPDEATDIRSHGPDGWHDQFLRYWTLKEAYLKARGLGIAVQLADVSFTLRPDGITLRCSDAVNHLDAPWMFDLKEFGREYLLATAVSPTLGTVPRIVTAPLPAAWILER